MSDPATAEGDPEDGESPNGPVELLRSVSPVSGGRRDAEMDVIGWSVFLGMLILLVPFLPIIAVVWVITKLLDALDPRE